MNDGAPTPRAIYRRLVRRFGPAGWWPGDSPFEVCLGAILVQNTSWTNVERALERLRRAGRLSFAGLSPPPGSRLPPPIPPPGALPGEAPPGPAFLGLPGPGHPRGGG